MNQKLRPDRVILITGASSGIGKTCAEYLSEQGYHVYGTNRKIDPDYGENIIDKEYPRLICMDVNDGKSVKSGIDLILKTESHIDIVVNNAGFGIAGAIEESSVAEIKSQFETNFIGTVRVIKTILPQMREQNQGYIINISSIAGLTGIPFQGAYSASKFGVEGLTESLRMEVKPFNIKVVLIEPGDFKTGFTANRIKTKKSQESDVYTQKMDTALGIMEEEEENGAEPKKIALLLERIINKTNPRLRYTTGSFVQRIVPLIKRILPGSFFEWIIRTNYKV